MKHSLTQLGEELHKIKRDKKTTLARMARAAGVRPVHLSTICHGRSNPSFQMLRRIAEKYDKRMIILFIDNKE